MLLQNAQALTSAYANQDYVGQYNDKLTLKCGGRVRRKAGFGTEFADALPGLGNLASSITGVQGLGELGTAIGQGISANQQINENKRIAQEAEQRKQLQAGQQQLNITSDKMINPMTMYQRSSFINKYKCGGRRKAWIGAAIGAAGSLIGGMFKVKVNNQFKLNKLTKLVIVLLKLVLNVLNGLLMVLFNNLLCLNQYIEIG